jgi:hypothetical protein
MAGEWIAVDLSLPEKPEFQEIMDLTGRDEAWVEFLLIRLWGWASMHCADGTARMTLPRLVRTCGADDAFWRAVAAVGWLEIDETAATVAVPGWDRRFSQAAKSRIQHRDRAAAQNEREPGRKRGAGPGCAQAQAPAAPERSRGEEIRGEVPPPPPPADAWAELRAAWHRGPGRPWKPAEPPDGLADRLAEPGWLTEALEAIPRLSACRYFKTPPTLIQFVGPGFVRRVLGGQYDDAKPARGPAHLEDRPQAKAWSGDDAARLEATRKAMAAKLAQEVA